MLRTNVCVVGAGPAGTVASLFLSKNKVPHILVDRAIFPREKVCGEFFDGRLQHVLNKIHPDFMQRMQEKNIIQVIRRYAFINSNLKQIVIDTPLNMTARISANRYDFDNYLLTEALKSEYVQYFDNTNISEGAVTEKGVSLSNSTKSFEIEAQAAILATGSNSPLSQKLVPQNRAKGHFLLAARGYYRNIAKPENQNRTQVYIFRQPFPYFLCLVHLPNNLATAEVCILKTVAAKHRASPESLLLNVIREHPEIKKNICKRYAERQNKRNKFI
ncbi:MAG: FAD-dependent oxidoreductase [Haliscomenobacter sp.]|nr:FAD-dependent oxidoreductase [Haliscomenobacter sp.]